MRRIWLIGAVVLGLMLGGQLGFAGAQDPAKPKKLNPYTGNLKAIEEGRKLYPYFGCDACHGAQGGGGMAPGVPLLDDYWWFGSDDETLLKLIRGEIPGQKMPAYTKEDITEDQIWTVLAFIRTLYKGDPSRIDW